MRTSTRPKRRIGHNKGPALRPTAQLLPKGAAVIYKPTRSVMTSGRRGTKQWILRFERRLAPYVEPLMGWTADDDPMAHVELMFDSLKPAIRYAEDQDLHYRVLNQVGAKPGLE